MSSYTWQSYPAHGTSNFELVARASLEGNKDNCAALETRLNDVESGTFFSSLVSPTIPSTAIISITPELIADYSLPYTKLDISGTPLDQYTLVFDSGLGKFTYAPLAGGGTDTYTVKWEDSDTPAFLENYVATDSELISGSSSSKLITPEGQKLGAITASVNNLGAVSGSVSIGPTHGVHVLDISAATEITFNGMTDSTVHYSIMLIIDNTTGQVITWGSTINWPGGSEQVMSGARYRLLVSTYDGGVSYDASQVIEYA